MHNPNLAVDYVERAVGRLGSVDHLYEGGYWADVVRESQEVVELALKGLLHSVGINPPREHDVAMVLREKQDRLAPDLADDVSQLAAVSRSLRRDRELAFDGAEDVTPSKYFEQHHADAAREAARLVVRRIRPHVLAEGPEQRTRRSSRSPGR